MNATADRTAGQLPTTRWRTRDIADAITATGTEVNKSEVRLPNGVLRTKGEFDIDVQLHAEVTQTVKVTVVPL